MIYRDTLKKFWDLIPLSKIIFEPNHFGRLYDYFFKNHKIFYASIPLGLPLELLYKSLKKGRLINFSLECCSILLYLV